MQNEACECAKNRDRHNTINEQRYVSDMRSNWDTGGRDNRIAADAAEG